MVGLDRDGCALHRNAFNHVRVESSLDQERGIPEASSFLLEDLDEESTDDAPLLLRIRHPLQSPQKGVACIHRNEFDAQGFTKDLLDLDAFILTHQSMVDENTGQLLAHGTMHEGRGHGGIHAPGQSADHAGVSHLLSDRFDRFLDEGVHRPILPAAANLDQEIFQDPGTAFRVNHLGMELQAPNGRVAMANGREGGMAAARNDLETRREGQHAIAMTHPDHVFALAIEPPEEGVIPLDLQMGASVFAIFRRLHLSAQSQDQQLKPVADAEDGNAQFEDSGVDIRGTLLEYARGPAGEHDPSRIKILQRIQGHIAGVNLAIDMEFTNPPRNQLRILRTEVQNQDTALIGIRRCHGGPALLANDSEKRGADASCPHFRAPSERGKVGGKA